MKTISSIMFTLSFVVTVNAQSIEEIAAKINRPCSTAELATTRASLEKLCSENDVDWLPLYYMVYTDLSLFFRTENTNTKLNYLQDAKKYLGQIKGGNASEVETLQGYWYMALITTNAHEYGAKYASQAISNFENAISLNPENPRAIILNAIFKSNMQKSLGGNYPKFNDDMQRAYTLLTQTDTTTLLPHWGQEFYKLPKHD